jgi:hypothetical protein
LLFREHRELRHDGRSPRIQSAVSMKRRRGLLPGFAIINEAVYANKAHHTASTEF